MYPIPKVAKANLVYLSKIWNIALMKRKSSVSDFHGSAWAIPECLSVLEKRWPLLERWKCIFDRFYIDFDEYADFIDALETKKPLCFSQETEMIETRARWYRIDKLLSGNRNTLWMNANHIISSEDLKWGWCVKTNEIKYFFTRGIINNNLYIGSEKHIRLSNVTNEDVKRLVNSSRPTAVILPKMQKKAIAIAGLLTLYSVLRCGLLILLSASQIKVSCTTKRLSRRTMTFSCHTRR